ncbi:DoxX family protein [Planococcus shixiaomingii]|uniref:DoxX family protein n=1 Tax=Planococcus shixiaomingii TaxID=3058393 RepID=UPI002625266C|nr:DoxX family protein [Planococcus sp. N022]WKA55212.1 DoxX family protein [Planococcus sp. N022]
MKWIVRIIQGLLMVIYFMTGFLKLSGDPTQEQAFAEIYGYGAGFMYVVGVLEILAALGLLIGFWNRKWAIAASALIIVIMAGAVFTHLQAGQGFSVASFPFILLLFAAAVFFGQKRFNTQPE